MLEIGSNLDFERYLKSNNITREEFNELIRILAKNKFVDGILNNCKSFNQPVIVPNFIRRCNSMFEECSLFNQPIMLQGNVAKCNSILYNASNLLNLTS